MNLKKISLLLEDRDLKKNFGELITRLKTGISNNDIVDINISEKIYDSNYNIDILKYRLKTSNSFEKNIEYHGLNKTIEILESYNGHVRYGSISYKNCIIILYFSENLEKIIAMYSIIKISSSKAKSPARKPGRETG